MVERAEIVHQFRKQALHANVARACRNCGAPGFWHDVEGVNPGCYDPRKKMEALARYEGFAPVGPICPQCGHDREGVEAHGEIWSKVWRGPSVWERVVDKITQWRFK
jgi:hypothetical protein